MLSARRAIGPNTGHPKLTDDCEALVEISVGDRTYRLVAIEMAPEEGVTEWRRLTLQARQQMGPISTGIGFIGSLDWVLAGSLAVGAIEGLLTSAAQKEGLSTLKRSQAVCAGLRPASRLVPITEIQNIELPSPLLWRGVVRVEGRVEVKSLTRAEQAALFASSGQPVADVEAHGIKTYSMQPFLCTADDFVTARCIDSGKRTFRWSSIDTYRVILANGEVV